MPYLSPVRQKASLPISRTDFEKKVKEAIFHLAEVEKECKNAKYALAGFEKQSEELCISLKRFRTQLALAMKKTKKQ